MSIYEGILHIQHPSELKGPTINYSVLALAMVFEGFSFTVAYRAFGTVKGDRRALSAIHHGKDPSLFTVLIPDSAALTGLVVAVWLAWESKALLVGESADPHLADDVRLFAGDAPVVTGVGAVLTMHPGPEEVLLNLGVESLRAVSADGERVVEEGGDPAASAPQPEATPPGIDKRHPAPPA